MKTISKIFCLILVLTLSLTILAGCATDELVLLSALSKQPEITSSESKTDVTFNLTSEGLKDYDKESFEQIAAMLNGMKIEINQKFKSNAEKTVSQAQADLSVDMNGISTKASVWVDTDLTGDVPKVKEIFKVPSLLTMFMSSENQGKDYMVLDTDSMFSSKDAAVFNTSGKQLMQYSTKLTPKVMNFIKDFARNSNPGFSIVTGKGSKTVDNQTVSVYNLKLDDSTFKKLLSYTVTSLAQNENALNLFRDLSMDTVDISGLSYMERMKAKGEINRSFEKFKSELPEFLKTWDNIMASVKDVKILGDKGIDIDFGINSQGYIVSESGTCDFVINLKEISAAYENFNALEDPDYIKEESKEEGIIKLGITFNTVNTKINKDIVIDFPAVTPENSFNFSDMLNMGRSYSSVASQEYSYEPDTAAPDAPVVNKVLKTSKTVTGKSEAFTTITVKKGETVIGEGISDEKGNFTVDITPVKTNCTLTVTATDVFGNESKATTVKVDK